MGKKHLLSYQSTKNDEEEDENNCKNTLFFGLFDDSESTKLRNGSMKRQYSDMGDLYHRVYEEHDDGNDKGSKMDMRVLMILEYMRELYVGQLQLLKKMFPGGSKDEFLGFFNKIGDAVSHFKQDSSRHPEKSLTMQRSLSAGSNLVRLRGVNLGSQDLKNERFKVTTVDPGGGAGGAAGAGGGAAGGASGSAGGGKGGSAATTKK